MNFLWYKSKYISNIYNKAKLLVITKNLEYFV